MKKFSKNMLAHLNAANKESKAVEQQKEVKLNKEEFDELEKYGVIL